MHERLQTINLPEQASELKSEMPRVSNTFYAAVVPQKKAFN